MENKNTITTESVFQAAKTWKRVNPIKKGRKSKLAPHLDTIRYMRSNKHMSYKEICDFFNSQGISTTYANLLSFVKRNKIGR